MAYLTASDLLAAAVGQTVDFDAPGLGKVRLRSLTVLEYAELAKDATDVFRTNMRTVALGMVEPAISFEELMEMRAGMIALFIPIAERIAELSTLRNTVELANFPGGG